jgi:hypothetical protein
MNDVNYMLKIITKTKLSIILNRYNIKNNNLNNIFELYPYKYHFKNNIFYILENYYFLYFKKL